MGPTRSSWSKQHFKYTKMTISNMDVLIALS